MPRFGLFKYPSEPTPLSALSVWRLCAHSCSAEPIDVCCGEDKRPCVRGLLRPSLHASSCCAGMAHVHGSVPAGR